MAPQIWCCSTTFNRPNLLQSSSLTSLDPSLRSFLSKTSPTNTVKHVRNCWNFRLKIRPFQWSLASIPVSFHFLFIYSLFFELGMWWLMGCSLVSSENTENEITKNNFFSFSTFVHKVSFAFRKRFVRENENDAPNVFLQKKKENKNKNTCSKNITECSLKDPAIVERLGCCLVSFKSCLLF